MLWISLLLRAHTHTHTFMLLLCPYTPESPQRIGAMAAVYDEVLSEGLEHSSPELTDEVPSMLAAIEEQRSE